MLTQYRKSECSGGFDFGDSLLISRLAIEIQIKSLGNLSKKHAMFKIKVVDRELDGEVISPQSTNRKALNLV
jgi:hypothetical protein